MPRARTLGVVALVTCALCAPLLAPVHADEELKPETQAARAHYRAGLAYFREGDLHRAIEEFIASRNDDPRPELDYNLGLAYDRLEDAVHAIDSYHAFLAARPQSEERAKLEAHMAELEQKVGELVVSCRVPDATITVDDSTLDAAQLKRPVRLSAGTHVVTARKEGYDATQASTVIIGQQRVDLVIAPRAHVFALSKRAKLGVGLGVALGALAITGVALGVYFGTRPPAPFDPHGAGGIVSVRPIGGGTQ